MGKLQPMLDVQCSLSIVHFANKHTARQQQIIDFLFVILLQGFSAFQDWNTFIQITSTPHTISGNLFCSANSFNSFTWIMVDCCAHGNCMLQFQLTHNYSSSKRNREKIQWEMESRSVGQTEFKNLRILASDA